MNTKNRMSAAFICAVLVFIACLILCSGPVQSAPPSGAAAPYVSEITAAGETTDFSRAEEHEEITRDLISILDHDPKLKAMPWEISPYETYSSLYDRIDQEMGCLYFICDQPLKELEDQGYYHNSVLYHEPFRSWWIRYLSGSGQFLSTPEPCRMSPCFWKAAPMHMHFRTEV